MYQRQILNCDYIKKEEIKDYIKMYEFETTRFFSSEQTSIEVNEIINIIKEAEAQQNVGQIDINIFKSIDYYFFETFIINMRWLFELELLRILDKCNVIDDLKGYISYFEHQTYEFDEGITLHRVEGFLTIEQAPFSCISVPYGGFISLPDIETNGKGEIASFYIKYNDFRLLSKCDVDTLFYVVSKIQNDY